MFSKSKISVIILELKENQKVEPVFLHEYLRFK